MFTVEKTSTSPKSSFILKEFIKYSELTVSTFVGSWMRVLICFQWVTSVGLGGAAAADILIAVSLVYFLGKNRTGFEAYVTFLFDALSYVGV